MCNHFQELYDEVGKFLYGQCKIKCVYCGVENIIGYINHTENCPLERLISAYHKDSPDSCECKEDNPYEGRMWGSL